jgi:hypothetical protein
LLRFVVCINYKLIKLPNRVWVLCRRFMQKQGPEFGIKLPNSGLGFIRFMQKQGFLHSSSFYSLLLRLCFLWGVRLWRGFITQSARAFMRRIYYSEYTAFMTRIYYSEYTAFMTRIYYSEYTCVYDADLLLRLHVR